MDSPSNHPMSTFSGNSLGGFSEEAKREIEQDASRRFGVPLNDEEVMHGYSRKESSELETCPRCQGATQRRLCRVVGGSGEESSLWLFAQAWFCSSCQAVVFDQAAFETVTEPAGCPVKILGLELAARRQKNFFLTWNDAWVLVSEDEKRRPIDRMLFPSLRSSSDDETEVGDCLDLSLNRHKPGIISLKHPKFGDRSFSSNVVCCDNPSCPCYALTMVFLPLTADAQERAPGTSTIRVQLDVQEKTVEAVSSGRSGGGEAKAFARALQDELTAGDWEAMFKSVYRWKRHLFETVDLETVQAMFPDEMRYDPTTIDMVSVFPGYPEMECPIDGKTWFVVDAHCINPHCACGTTFLHCFPPKEIVEERGSARPVVLCYERHKKRLEKTEDNPTGDPQLPYRLWESLRNNVPDLHARLEKNAGLLARLYVKWLERQPPMTTPPMRKRSSFRPLPETEQDLAERFPPAGETPPAPAATGAPTPFTAGRNDPCPCGSGKKYKKCCGA